MPRNGENHQAKRSNSLSDLPDSLVGDAALSKIFAHREGGIRGSARRLSVASVVTSEVKISGLKPRWHDGRTAEQATVHMGAKGRRDHWFDGGMRV